ALSGWRQDPSSGPFSSSSTECWQHSTWDLWSLPRPPFPDGLARRARNPFGLLRGPFRLVVGVDERQLQYSPASGHGRVWSNILSRLAEHVELAVRTPAGELSTASAPQVWLADGHRG